ncbi:MAG: hypothetical protein MUE73_07405 [Planctomycetes bacterium]|jgi:hypothetical protein|nr:hypothetical protein [Planctomycetota bacterium]
MRAEFGAGGIRGAVCLVIGVALGAASYALGAAGDHPPIESMRFVLVDAGGAPVGSFHPTGLNLGDGKWTYFLESGSGGISQRSEVARGGYARWHVSPVRSLLEFGHGIEKPELRLLTGQEDNGPNTTYEPGASLRLEAPGASLGLSCRGAGSSLCVSGASGAAGLWSGGESPDSPLVGVGVDSGHGGQPELAMVSGRDGAPALRILDRTTRKLRFALTTDREGNVRLYFYDRGGKLTKTLP